MNKYFIQYKGEKTFSEVTKEKAIAILEGNYKNKENVLELSRKDFPVETCFSYIWKE